MNQINERNNKRENLRLQDQQHWTRVQALHAKFLVPQDKKDDFISRNLRNVKTRLEEQPID